MTETAPWTLERVEAEVRDLAPVARFHRVLEESAAAAERTVVAHGRSLHPAYPGAPALHWLHGKPLLDACDARPILEALPLLVNASLTALASLAPREASAFQGLLRRVRETDFPWDRALAAFRSPAELPETPDPALFHFLLLRAISRPARHLARSVSAPHPDRWKRSHCPFCGVGAAAAVARVGSGRTLLCVLCGGRWETAETICPGCLETNLDRFRILAARELGPATLESCLSCGTTLKVFSSPDLLWGPPLAMEVLTIRLDIVAARDEGIRRDAVACAALHPPR